MTSIRATVARFVSAAAVLASLGSAGCTSMAQGGAQGESADWSEVSDFARNGVYAGLYGIRAYEKFDTDGSRIHTGNSDLGAGIRIGYRASPAIAVEVMAENIEGFEVDDGDVDADLDLTNFGAMGKLFLAENRFQPYLLAGAGLARSEVRHFDFDDDGWFARGGLGLDVYLTSNVALFGEANYNWMQGDTKDLDNIAIMAGILFRF